MSIASLTDPLAVTAALDEFDELGRDKFLAEYGYGKAKSYFLVRDGKRYDSKAIAGVAVGKQHPEEGPLAFNDFSGGDSQVAERLRKLGFDVVGPASPGAVYITEEEIRLLAVSRSSGSRFTDLSVEQKSAYADIHDKLRQLARLAVSVLGEKDYTSQLTSQFFVEVGVRGSVPKDLWFGVWRRENKDAFLKNPQLYAIVSERGVELGFSASTHPSDFSDQTLKARLRAASPAIYNQLPAPGSATAVALATDLGPDWKFQRKSRLPSTSSDFPDLAAWLAHFHSNASSAGGGAICRYVEGGALAKTDLAQAVTVMAEEFKPLMDAISATTGSPEKLPSDPASGKVGSFAFAEALGGFTGRFAAIRTSKLRSDAELRRCALAVGEFVLGTAAATAELRFDWSAGKGNFANVPWFALLDPRLTTSTQRGIYIVLLISNDLSRAYLTLNQGMTELVAEHRQRGAVQVMNERSARFRSMLEPLTSAGFQLDSSVDLATSSWRSKMYEKGTIAHKRYDLGRLPTDAEAEADFSALIAAYSDIADLELETPDSRPAWFVGSVWDGEDQLDRFAAEGIWENGYEEGPTLDEVRQIRVGDRIAIKAAFTRKHDLPFSYGGKTASVMRIKAVGTVTAEAKDGKVLKVDWQPGFAPRDWYFYTARDTIWRVEAGTDYSDQLIAFTFSGAQQDYEWFLSQPGWVPKEETGDDSTTPAFEESTLSPPYPLEDALDGLFIRREEFERLLAVWKRKKNLVLQGPPGVGKTFIAERLAFALMEQADRTRLAMVQFHQSYGYEDFMQGLRPTASGGFERRDGAFFRFCSRAGRDPGRPYVFIIDEINRGNLSKIFGELMLLIETDKRSDKWATRLVYSGEDDAPFFVPSNVYVLGMMNTADRSLAVVDYALRRRFAFANLEPAFDTPAFKEHLQRSGADDAFITHLISRMGVLNRAIVSDRANLGAGFQVGHSYFSGSGPINEAWLSGIVETEVRPLLEEYWFDNPDTARTWAESLLAP